jgi:hypothetical protein
VLYGAQAERYPDGKEAPKVPVIYLYAATTASAVVVYGAWINALRKAES